MKFDHYEILCREDGTMYRLGQGAASSSYKAMDVDLQVPVVLKVMRSELMQDDAARKRFLREARAAAAVRHPNVAQIYRLGEHDGSCFYAREFLEGETVETRVSREGPLAIKEAVRIAREVAQALVAVKKMGLVHREIKPSNLMISPDGSVKIIDFGLAKSGGTGDAQNLGSITISGFMGTAEYASPEQLNEKELDVSSDIYALGCTLWFMLAGRPPFRGAVALVMGKHLQTNPPFEELSQFPQAVRSLIAQMLEKEPASRPASPAQLVEELTRCIAELEGDPKAEGEAVRTPKPEPTFKRMTANREPASSTPARYFLLSEVLVGALIALIIYFVLTRPMPPPASPESAPSSASVEKDGNILAGGNK